LFHFNFSKHSLLDLRQIWVFAFLGCYANLNGILPTFEETYRSRVQGVSIISPGVRRCEDGGNADSVGGAFGFYLPTAAPEFLLLSHSTNDAVNVAEYSCTAW